MSLLKANSVQIGQSATATQNFTLSVPSSPDGTIKLARGNSGATTADILSINASGVITGSTFSGATINSSTVNGGTITSGTAVASTSGTAIDFTSIPSWVKRVTVIFGGVSHNGTSHLLVQLGSGSITSSGYISTGNSYAGAGSTATTNSTSGFIVYYDNVSDTISGIMSLHLISGNSWVSSHSVKGNTAGARTGGGDVSLSGALDRVRVTSVSTDTFDAGSVNILYEG